MNQQIASRLYHDLSEAMSKHDFTIKDIMSICSDVISDNANCSSERESHLYYSLSESFNVSTREFRKYDIFSLASALGIVFPKGITAHSQLQIKNYEAYKEAFSKLNESDKNFLKNKYPHLASFN
jgi:hypothetical protein